MRHCTHHPIIVNEDLPAIKAQTHVLSGLRLAVKDLFHIKGIETSAGNPHWLTSHSIPQQTNSCVLKLLHQGANYVGKTLTDELAYSLNGQNIHYPSVTNAVTPDRIAGGSSSGSALAVAHDIADIGLGTDTGGSIRVPASYNGLFGLRTSHGLVATDNMVPLAPSFDTVGWMTRNIEHMLQVTQALVPQTASDQLLNGDIKLMSLSNLVAESEQNQQINQWLGGLEGVDCHHTQVDLQQWNISEVFRVLQGYDIWQQHGQWIETTSPVFADDIQTRLTWCKEISEQNYAQARKQQQVIIGHILNLFDACDLIAIPTTPGKAPLLNTPAAELANYRNTLMALTAIAGIAGLPQLHMPLFSLDGASCGLSSDALLKRVKG